MVRELLKIRSYVDGTEKDPTFHDIEIFEYEYSVSRMGLPTLTATIMYPTCLDEEWNDKLYVTFFNQRLFIKETATSSKSNDDGRYKHEVTFRSEWEVLNDVYFYDVIGDASTTKGKYCSNSTTFSFYGSIREFADRLNCAFLKAGVGDSILSTKMDLTTDSKVNGDGFCAMIDEFTDFDLDATAEISFEGSKLWDAISTAYEALEVTFELKGRTIIFGGISEVVDRVFKYGAGNELLSITKTNANTDVINRVTFVGSDTNIPYYYPNANEFGSVKLDNSKLYIKSSELLCDKVREGERVTCEINAGGAVTRLTSLDTANGESLQNDSKVMLGADSKAFELHVGFYVSGNCYVTVSSILGAFYYEHSGGGGSVDFLTYKPSYNDSEAPVLTLYNADESKVKDLFVYDGKVDLGALAEGDYYISIILYFPTTTYIDYENEEREGYDTTYVQLGKVSFSSEARSTNQYRGSVSGSVWSTLSEIGVGGALAAGESFSWTSTQRIDVQEKLMPPIYRESGGVERFYNATNNTHIDPDTGEYYVFPKPYKEGSPKEYIYTNEDIYPTIEGVTNAAGQLLGEIVDIAYDDNDSDELKTDSDSDDETDVANYQHSYFYIKLHLFDGANGFSLFDAASQTDAMTIAMTSGNCNGCKFKIQSSKFTGEDGYYFFKNPVKVKEANGDIVSGDYDDKVSGDEVTYDEMQACQQDTTQNEIWICLQKDIDTFGVIIPNVTNKYHPAVGDTFKITGINLPEGYITAAEERGMQEAIRYMYDNNEEQFTFSMTFSRIFFANNPDILSQISEYSRLQVEYNGIVRTLYVSSFKYTCKGSELLPEISVELVDTITIGDNFVQSVAARVESMISNTATKGGGIGSGGSGLSATQIDKRYLRKDKADTANGKITFNKGFKTNDNAEFGNFVSGFAGMGGQIDNKGNAQFESVLIRSAMEVYELIVNRQTALEGDYPLTEADTVESIEDLGDGCYRLHLRSKWDGYFTAQVEHNVIKGMINTLGSGNSDYYTSWMRVNSVNEAANSIEVILYPDDETPAGKNYPPCELMRIARWGNQDDETRQSLLYLSSSDGRIMKLKNVTKPIIDDANYAFSLGTLPEFVLRDHSERVVEGLDYLYADGVVCKDIIQIDHDGNVRVTYVDRGTWSAGEEYFCAAMNGTVYETSDVWWLGCKWRCCKTGTKAEPAWNTADWVMIEGNPDFTVDFEEAEQLYDADNFHMTLTMKATLYRRDVTSSILTDDIVWTRYSEDAEGNPRTASDNLWAINHAGIGGQLNATIDDLDVTSSGFPKKVVFTCTATLRDGLTASATMTML